MYSHAAEVAPEARLEIGARRGVERLPGRAQRLMHAGWRLADGGMPRGPLFLKFFLLIASRAFAADPRRRGGHRGPRGGHAHHLVGDAIRLMLKRIIHRADFELRLKAAQ